MDNGVDTSSLVSDEERGHFGIDSRHACFPQRRPRVDENLFQASLPLLQNPVKRMKTSKGKRIKHKRHNTEFSKSKVALDIIYTSTQYTSKTKIADYLDFCGNFTLFHNHGKEKPEDNMCLIREREKKQNIALMQEQSLSFLQDCGNDIEFAKFRIIATLGATLQETLIKEKISAGTLFYKYLLNENDLTYWVRTHKWASAISGFEAFENWSNVEFNTTEKANVRAWMSQVKRVLAENKSSRPIKMKFVEMLLRYGLRLEQFLSICLSLSSDDNINITNSIKQGLQEIFKGPLQSLVLLKRKCKKIKLNLAKAQDLASLNKPQERESQIYSIADIDAVLQNLPSNVLIPEADQLKQLRELWINLENKVDNFWQVLCGNNKLQAITESQIQGLIKTCRKEGILFEMVNNMQKKLNENRLLCEEIEQRLGPNLYAHVTKRRSGSQSINRENFLSLESFYDLKKKILRFGITTDTSKVVCSIIAKAENWLKMYNTILNDKEHKIKDLILLKQLVEIIPVQLLENTKHLDEKIMRAQEWLSKIKFNLKSKGPKTKQTRSISNKKDQKAVKMDVLSLKALRKEAVHLGLEKIEIENLEELIRSVEDWLREASLSVLSAETNVLSFKVISHRNSIGKNYKNHSQKCYEIIGNLEGNAVAKELELLRYQADDFPADLSREFEFLNSEIKFYSFWDSVMSRLSSEKLTIPLLHDLIENFKNIQDELPETTGYLNFDINSALSVSRKKHDSSPEDASTYETNGLSQPNFVSKSMWKVQHTQALEDLLSLAKDLIISVEDVTQFMYFDNSKWQSLSHQDRVAFMLHREEKAHLFDLKDLKELITDISLMPLNLTNETRHFLSAVDEAENCKKQFNQILKSIETSDFKDLEEKFRRSTRLGILFPELLLIRKEIIVRRSWNQLAKELITYRNKSSSSIRSVSSFAWFDKSYIDLLISVGEDLNLLESDQEIPLKALAKHIDSKQASISKFLENFEPLNSTKKTSYSQESFFRELSRNSDESLKLSLNLFVENEYLANISNTIFGNDTNIRPEASSLIDTNALDRFVVATEKVCTFHEELKSSSDFYLTQNLSSYSTLAVCDNVIRSIKAVLKAINGPRMALNTVVYLIICLQNFLECCSSNGRLFFIPEEFDKSQFDSDVIKNIGLWILSKDSLVKLNNFVPFKSRFYPFVLDTFKQSKMSASKSFLAQNLDKLGVKNMSTDATQKNLIDEDLILHSRPKRCIKPAYSVRDLKNPFAGFVEVAKPIKSNKLKEEKQKNVNKKISKVRRKTLPQGCIPLKSSLIKDSKCQRSAYLQKSRTIDWSKEETLLLDTKYDVASSSMMKETGDKKPKLNFVCDSLRMLDDVPQACAAVEWMLAICGKAVSLRTPINLNNSLTGSSTFDTAASTLKFLQSEVRRVIAWRRLVIKSLRSSHLEEQGSVEVYKRLLNYKKTHFSINIKVEEESKLETELANIQDWIYRVNLTLKPNMTTQVKPTEAQLEKLLAEGAKLKGKFKESESLKTAINKGKQWLNKLNSSGLDKGIAKISFLRELLEEALTLPIDVTKQVNILKQATKRYCLCKEPSLVSPNLMINCIDCNEIFHRKCVFFPNQEVLNNVMNTFKVSNEYTFERFRCLVCSLKRRLQVSRGFLHAVYTRSTASLEVIQANDSYDNNSTSRDYHFFKHYNNWLRKALDYFNSNFYAVLEKAEPSDIEINSIKAEAGLFPNLYEARLVLQALKSSKWISTSYKNLSTELKIESKIRIKVLQDILISSKEASIVDLLRPVKAKDGSTTTKVESFVSTDTLPGLNFIRQCCQRAVTWQAEATQILNCDRTFAKKVILEKCRGLIDEHKNLIVAFMPELKKLIAVVDDDANRHCICDGFNDGLFMVSCEKCDIWFHGKCVNVTNVSQVENWMCTKCLPA